MPQLDPNTFIYQYFGIITLLILVYTILSYGVLPILLRLLLVRNLFLLTLQKLSIRNHTTVVEWAIITFKKPIYNGFLLNRVVLNTTKYFKNLLDFLKVSIQNIIYINTAKNDGFTKNTTVFLDEFVTTYLVLLLSETENDNN